MSVKLPATILDTNVDTSVRRVASVHCKRMYESFVQEATIVVHKTIRQDQPWMDGTREVEKWLGSERWLWNWLESMATITGDTAHGVFEDDFAKPFLNGTDKPPIWTRNTTVFKRHKAELYYMDNIDRLETRFNRSEIGRRYRDGLGRSFRIGPTTTSFEYACSETLGDGWKGLTAEQFTDEFIRRVIRHFGLYRIGWREFLNRNRYRQYIPWRYRREDLRTRPYKQKVASNRAIAEILQSRRPQEARLHRRGQAVEMESWFDADALDRMVQTLETFTTERLGASYETI
jgi:hypothetical protein